jgi:hypothetical protein
MEYHILQVIEKCSGALGLLEELQVVVSPYAFSENRLIDAIELEGLEKVQLMTEGQALWDAFTYTVSEAFDGVGEALDDAGDAVSEGLNATGNWLNGLAGDGGYTMTSDYAPGTNNADRKGNPSGTKDVTAVEARANATSPPPQGLPRNEGTLRIEAATV